MTIHRVQADIGGFAGGPGINSWYFTFLPGGGPLDVTSANAAAQALQDFYQLTAQQLQSDVSITVLPDVTEIDETNGQVTNVVVATIPLAPTAGQGSDPASHATHVKIRLRTDTFLNGRRIQGGPFFGPIPGTAIGANGDIVTSQGQNIVTQLTSAYSGLSSSNQSPVVWRRPSFKGATDGAIGLVTQVSYFPRPAVLRSRRD